MWANDWGWWEFLLKVSGKWKYHSLEWDLCELCFGCSSGGRQCQAALFLLFAAFQWFLGASLASLSPSMSHSHQVNNPVALSARSCWFFGITSLCSRHCWSWGHLSAGERISGDPQMLGLVIPYLRWHWFQTRNQQIWNFPHKCLSALPSAFSWIYFFSPRGISISGPFM